MKTYNSRTGTIQSKNPQPHLWLVGKDDPRKHFAYRVYIQSRNQATFREEPWNFEFTEWYDMWFEHFDKRGRKVTEYGMTRTDANLPWSKANCFVATRKETMQHICKLRAEEKLNAN